MVVACATSHGQSQNRRQCQFGAEAQLFGSGGLIPTKYQEEIRVRQPHTATSGAPLQTIVSGSLAIPDLRIISLLSSILILIHKSTTSRQYISSGIEIRRTAAYAEAKLQIAAEARSKSDQVDKRVIGVQAGLVESPPGASVCPLG